MKKLMVIAPAILICMCLCTGKTFAADASKPVVTKITEGSGPWHGYKVTCPAYEFRLACTPEYGFYRFWLTKDGEKVTESSETATSIYDDKNKKYFFSAFESHKTTDEFMISDSDGEIAWELSPSVATKADYGGRLVYGPNRIALTHQWLMHEDVEGRVIVAKLLLGIPLLTGCPFKAVLTDGTTVEGNIPAELPEEWTVYTSDKAGRTIQSVTFETKKGPIKMTFIPDKSVDLARISQPRLATILHKELNPPFRRYEFLCEIPAGKKDILQSYTIVFEFPE